MSGAADKTPDCAGRNGAHTPWKAASDPLHYDSKTDVVDARGDLVACMCGSDVAAMEANARLIAAAPELMGALKLIAEGKPENPIGDPWAFYDDLVNVARAAIAKAEGPTNA